MTKSEKLKQEQASIADSIRERIEKERASFKAKGDKKVTDAFVKDQIVIEDLGKSIGSAFANSIKPSGYAIKKHKKPTKRMVNVAFSDTHYHALLEGNEGTMKYGPVEEARATAKVILEAVEFKPQYRDNTTLMVHIFGDIIQGNLHDPRESATITEQFAAAVYILTQAIYFASQHFPSVQVKCVTGNHGRNKLRHKDRAVTQKWDSFESLIYYAIKTALANVPNINIEIPLTPYYLYQSFDKRGFVTHGDTIISAGMPSSIIDIKRIRNQVNEWNAVMGRSDLYMIGHVHCGSKVHLPSGDIFMSNGALIPADNYAISIGIPQTNCGAWVWESVEGYIVGDSRFISITKDTYNDRSLDPIIKPYLGFDSPKAF